MSVQSVTLGYDEACEKSHEFVRRGCSKTPKESSWAGDLLVVSGEIVKQSDVEDIQGEESDVEHVYASPNEACSDMHVSIPAEFRVEETDIRTGGKQSFSFLIPKNENEEDEANWELGIYQSTGGDDFCGLMGFDGGDALQHESDLGRVVSICGTIDRSSIGTPQAHYLDNRKSYEDDTDNGLLICIRTGVVLRWEMRYAPVGRNLSSGLAASDDVTAEFTTALSAMGMTHEDVFEFGMI